MSHVIAHTKNSYEILSFVFEFTEHTQKQNRTDKKKPMCENMKYMTKTLWQAGIVINSLVKSIFQMHHLFSFSIPIV